MKIGHSTEQQAATPAATTPASANGSAAAASVQAAIPVKADDSAKIELSSTASTLLSGGSSAEFDAQKVAAMSKAIEDGTFKVNPEAIADKLIANAQEIVAKVQS